MPKRLTPRGEAAPPVEPIITGATLPPKPEQKAQRKPKSTDTGVRYIRNLHHIQARVTLGSGREIQLKPRGEREDIDIVNKDEQQDPKFLANRDLVFEVITPAQAEKIIYKQQTNSRGQSLWDHLRNEKGKSYDQTAATIEEAFERQGVVVGRIEDTGSGRYTDHNAEVRRMGPEVVEAPGSPGHPATAFVQSVPPGVSPDEYHEFLLWKQFKLEQEHARALDDLKGDGEE